MVVSVDDGGLGRLEAEQRERESYFSRGIDECVKIIMDSPRNDEWFTPNLCLSCHWVVGHVWLQKRESRIAGGFGNSRQGFRFPTLLSGLTKASSLVDCFLNLTQNLRHQKIEN